MMRFVSAVRRSTGLRTICAPLTSRCTRGARAFHSPTRDHLTTCPHNENGAPAVDRRGARKVKGDIALRIAGRTRVSLN